MKVGRPTKYKKNFVQEVSKYIATTGREQMELPTLQGFALWIDCSLDAIADWKKLYPDFSGALKKLMLKQATQLINDGIYGGKEVNSTIIKLLLQNNHGMKERVDNTTNDKDLPYNQFTDEQLNRVIEAKTKQIGAVESFGGERKTD